MSNANDDDNAPTPPIPRANTTLPLPPFDCCGYVDTVVPVLIQRELIKFGVSSAESGRRTSSLSPKEGDYITRPELERLLSDHRLLLQKELTDMMIDMFAEHAQGRSTRDFETGASGDSGSTRSMASVGVVRTPRFSLTLRYLLWALFGLVCAGIILLLYVIFLTTY